MDNQKDIEEMAKAIYETGVAIDGTDIAFGLMEDSHFHRMAGKLYNEGYRLESEVRKEMSKEVYEWIKDFMEWDEEGVCRAFAEAYDIEVEE